jgi:hypothetical protein
VSLLDWTFYCNWLLLFPIWLRPEDHSSGSDPIPGHSKITLLPCWLVATGSHWVLQAVQEESLILTQYSAGERQWSFMVVFCSTCFFLFAPGICANTRFNQRMSTVLHNGRVSSASGIWMGDMESGCILYRGVSIGSHSRKLGLAWRDSLLFAPFGFSVVSFIFYCFNSSEPCGVCLNFIPHIWMAA